MSIQIGNTKLLSSNYSNAENTNPTNETVKKTSKEVTVIKGNTLNLNDSVDYEGQKADIAVDKMVEQLNSDIKRNEIKEGYRQRIGELGVEKLRCLKEIDIMEQKQDDLQQMYNIEDDSQEQKDLEILKKKTRMVELTTDENKRLKEMGPLTEYQQYSMEYIRIQYHWEKEVKLCDDEITKMVSSIIGHERSEYGYNPMVNVKQEIKQIAALFDEKIKQAIMEPIVQEIKKSENTDEELLKGTIIDETV